MNIMNVLLYGLQVMVVGLVVVFFGLTLLIFCFNIMTALTTRFAAKKQETPKIAPPVDSTPTMIEAVEAPMTDDGELTAVIAAAVAAIFEQSEETTSGFVVRSIRRVHNAPVWNRAGREEQVYSRL